VARAIRSVASEERPDNVLEPIESLGEELSKDRDSLAHFLDLLRLLDERGLLRLASDFAATNEELIRLGVDWLSRPETQRAVKNLRVLVRALERIDPDRLERVVREIGHAVDQGSKVGPSGPRIGAFALLRQLGDPDTNRGLRVLLAALKDFGAETK
jgi:uncharacterized protein YjgD (DUF1641 family)